MYAKMQESGLIQMISMVCTSSVWLPRRVLIFIKPWTRGEHCWPPLLARISAPALASSSPTPGLSHRMVFTFLILPLADLVLNPLQCSAILGRCRYTTVLQLFPLVCFSLGIITCSYPHGELSSRREPPHYLQGITSWWGCAWSFYLKLTISLCKILTFFWPFHEAGRILIL